jgi:phosphatidylserine/phosphatidylglycerophosphate/cardiolipin synthase-like enzyme
MTKRVFGITIFTAILAVSVFANAFTDQLSTAPEDGHEIFVQNIDNARRSIDMVMYHLSEVDVVNHLTAAAKRGVQIRIIIDHKILETNTTQKQLVSTLSAAGVAVKPSAPAFTLTHEKAAVFDNSWAIISSINLTRTASFTRDFGVLTQDSQVVAEMNSVFQSDWNNNLSTQQMTPALNVQKLVWSPINSESKISSLLESARNEIYLEVENLGDQKIIDILKQKAQSGVHVVVIVPGCVEGTEPTRNQPFLKDLASGGVQALDSMPPYTTENPYIHAKAIVVDQQTFFVGSENFSMNSLLSARELGLIEANAGISQGILNAMKIDEGNAKSVSSVAADFACPAAN